MVIIYEHLGPNVCNNYNSPKCQPSHVEPLKRVYGGMLGIADLKILSIFQLFETTRKASVASLLSGWSTSTDITSENPLEAIQSLEPSRVLKTCLEYPDWRKLVEEDKDEHDFSRSNDQLYDPAFVLLLFAQMLSESGPSSALAWVQLFRSNVVSLILRTLSAKDDALREIAWAQIAALYRLVEVNNSSLSPIQLLTRMTPAGRRHARKATCPTHPQSPQRPPSQRPLRHSAPPNVHHPPPRARPAAALSHPRRRRGRLPDAP